MKLKNIAMAVATVIVTTTPVLAMDSTVQAGLHNNIQAMMQHTYSHMAQGAHPGVFVFSSATNQLTGADSYLETSGLYFDRATINGNVAGIYTVSGSDKFQFNIIKSSMGSAISMPSVGLNPSYTESTVSIDVYQNGVLICSACDALYAHYGTDFSSPYGDVGVAIAYRDRRFSNYVVGAMKGNFHY